MGVGDFWPSPTGSTAHACFAYRKEFVRPSTAAAEVTTATCCNLSARKVTANGVDGSGGCRLFGR